MHIIVLKNYTDMIQHYKTKSLLFILLILFVIGSSAYINQGFIPVALSKELTISRVWVSIASWSSSQGFLWAVPTVHYPKATLYLFLPNSY